MPIVLLYILRIRRRRQVVPTLMFWDQIFRETAPRSLWRTFRHWLSLVLQLAFLLLLALALADPMQSGESQRPRHYVLVLDQSASMQATDGESSRFHEAKQLAARTVRAMRSQDQATIIAAGVQPGIACPTTYHPPTLHRALETVQFTDAPSDLRAALRLARSIDVGDGERRIVLLTDTPGAGSVEDARGDDVAVGTCGGTAANVGITAFGVRPRSDNPIELDGIIRLGNFGPEARTVEVKLRRDDALLDVLSVDLEAGEERVQTFRHVQEGGRLLRAELTGDDAFPLDDRAVAVLPPMKRHRVVLVSEGNVFLEGILSAHPWLDVIRLAPSDDWSPPAEADIYVFDGFVPDALPEAPRLFVNPQAACELWTLGDPLKNPIVSDLDEQARLLRHVNLRNCTILAGRPVLARAEAQTLASSFEAPLLVRWASGGPMTIVLGVDVRRGDLPLRTAFPILMQNILNDLAGAGGEAVGARSTGEPVELALDGGEVTASDSEGCSVPVSRSDEGWRVGPALRAGVVTVSTPDRKVDLAFNLFSGEESRIGGAATTRPASGHRFEVARSAWSWPLWVVLVVAAIALSATEWALHQRRRID